MVRLTTVNEKLDLIWVKSFPGECDLELSEIEAANRDVLYKKVFLKISQNSLENACARVSLLIKSQALDL